MQPFLNRCKDTFIIVPFYSRLTIYWQNQKIYFSHQSLKTDLLFVSNQVTHFFLLLGLSPIVNKFNITSRSWKILFNSLKKKKL